MTLEQLQLWIQQNQNQALAGLIIISLLGFLIARYIVGRGLVYLARRTKTQYDDILVRHLHPFRVAWIAPLIVVYVFSGYVQDYRVILEKGSLFLILWASVLILNALLTALNEIYESSQSYGGVSIQGYLDIIKILVVLVGIILSVSVFTGESPVVYLTSLGALTAILLLVFRDTILSIVASVQIAAHDLIKEGDWIEVPSYEADGDVLNMSLHTIKIQNWDKTISVIPTYKITEVAYKNWRGMKESGGRRIKRSITLDLGTIKFCDTEILTELCKIDLVHEFLKKRLMEIEQFSSEHREEIDSPLDGPQITNVEIFRSYIAAYLRSRDDIHQRGDLAFLVRALSPGRDGLPIEIYAFTTTTDWATYEQIQAEIFDHLLAAAQSFGLRVFQEPTGLDFSSVFIK